MAVKIRMTRMGRRHRPFFRINAIDSRAPRDGKIIEKLGHYDPIEKDPAKQVVLDRQRVEYWLGQGAIPSDTVSQILFKSGIKTKYAEQQTARRARALAAARAKGRPFNKADRIAIEKKAAEAAAEEKTTEAAPEKKAPEATEEKKAAKAPAEEKTTEAAAEMKTPETAAEEKAPETAPKKKAPKTAEKKQAPEAAAEPPPDGAETGDRKAQ
jgi:small subunit ribosomal protein S16